MRPQASKQYTVVLTLPSEFNGQAASLIRDGQVIGKAVIADGQAAISAHFGDERPTDGDLRVAMEADGAVPVSVPVKGLPAETALSATGPGSPQASEKPMGTSGRLDPGFASAKIVMRDTQPSGTGQPFERTVTTDANGNWRDSVVAKR